eukprot:6213896-Pleurochrysis_carterae.AAC.4
MRVLCSVDQCKCPFSSRPLRCVSVLVDSVTLSSPQREGVTLYWPSWTDVRIIASALTRSLPF